MHREEGIAVKDKKYKIGGIIGAVAVVVILGAFALIRSWQGQKPVAEKIGQLPDGKIYVKFVNSRRIYFDIFFPLDSQTMISDNYIVQRKSGKEWKAFGNEGKVSWEYGTPNDIVVDDKKYPDVTYESKQYEIAQRYDVLEKGSYRVIFGAETAKKEYTLAIPFEVTRDCEYVKEPEDYDYQVTTSVGQGELANAYEACEAGGKYITYDPFIAGFENQLFSLDMYQHLQKVQVVSGQKKSVLTTEKEKLEYYRLFAKLILTRTDKETYGSTYFMDLVDYRTLPVPDGQEQGKETVRVHFFFDYDGTKDLQCTISGHSMTVETGGFTFGEEISKRFPTGNLFPAKKQEKMTMHFYVFNDLEKALEEMEK